MRIPMFRTVFSPEAIRVALLTSATLFAGCATAPRPSPETGIDPRARPAAAPAPSVTPTATTDVVTDASKIVPDKQEEPRPALFSADDDARVSNRLRVESTIAERLTRLDEKMSRASRTVADGARWSELQRQRLDIEKDHIALPSVPDERWEEAKVALVSKMDELDAALGTVVDPL